MNSVVRLGLLLAVATAMGCLYPSLKTVTGADGVAGGTSAASGSGGTTGASVDVGGARDVPGSDAPTLQPEVPIVGAGGAGGVTGSGGLNAGGAGGSGGVTAGVDATVGIAGTGGGVARGGVVASGGELGGIATGGGLGTGGAAGKVGTGGVTGTAGVVVTGGMIGTGGVPGTGGIVGGGVIDAGGGTGGIVSTGVIDAGSGYFSPSCTELTTAAGAAPIKGGRCILADPQLCYKTCGPASTGFKSETCTSGAYVEQSGCSFPAGDYSCYKVPTTVDPTCPTTAPQASTACIVAACVVCAGTTGYLDSTGAPKLGYCVCPAFSTSGTRMWSCASATAWPCPAGQGC
jgi:hypothetical protein